MTEEDLAVGRLYPPLQNIREISVKIAARVAREAYNTGTAATYPEPEVRTGCWFYLLLHFLLPLMPFVGQGSVHHETAVQLQLRHLPPSHVELAKRRDYY